MIELILKLLATLGIMVPIFFKWPGYFTFKALDPRGWKLDKQKAKKIATVVIIGLAISLVLFPKLDDISFQAGPVIDESNPQVVLLKFSPALLLVIIATLPILEELVFRGCLLRLFNDKKGPIFALLASSALFGLFHVLNPGTYALAFISPFMAGIVFGWCYLAQGLPSAVLTHMGYNIVIFLWCYI